MLKGENKKKVFLERNVYVSMYIKIKKERKICMHLSCI